jgi:hypothetical protein
MGALLPILPLMLAQHKSIGPSWADPFSLHTAMTLMDELVFSLPLMAVLAAWWLSRLLGISESGIEPAALRRLAPMFAMLGVPAVLMAYSGIGESLMVNRYFIATLLGMPALMGLTLAETNISLKILLLVIFLGASTALVQANTSRLKYSQQVYEKTAQQAAGGYDLVFETSVEAFPVWFAYPNLRPRIAVIDFPPASDTALPRTLSHLQHIERNTEQMYDLPPRWDAKTIASHGPFWLIGNTEYLPSIQQWTPIVLVDSQRKLYEMRP